MTNNNKILIKRTNLIKIETQKRNKTKTKCVLKLMLGALIGFINGFWGGGGGMICVPALTFCCDKKDKVAHATALFVMLPISIVSFIVYCFGKSIDLNLSIFITIGFIVGGIVGALLLKIMKSVWIEIIFCLVIFACGIRMLI